MPSAHRDGWLLFFCSHNMFENCQCSHVTFLLLEILMCAQLVEVLSADAIHWYQYQQTDKPGNNIVESVARRNVSKNVLKTQITSNCS